MKIIIISATSILLVMAGCKKEGVNSLTPELESGATADAAMKVSLPPTINFSMENLFPEGLAYDAARHHFYVSSAMFGQIGIVAADGSYTPFITDERLTATTGLKIDRARNRLWVSNAEGGVGVYDLSSGSRIFYTDFSSLASRDVFINDLALDPQGNAWVTNSFGPEIFYVDVNGQASVYFSDPALALGPGEFGFTGIAYDERGFLLLAFLDQIFKMPVRDPSAYTVVQLDRYVYPDGLLLSKDGKQLVVVNNMGGTEDDSVVTFLTGDQWRTGAVSTTYSTGAVFPTSATSDGKRVFVLYSHIHRLIMGESQSDFTIQEVPLQQPDHF